METTVIGIDFSTSPAKTGLARATAVESGAVLHQVRKAGICPRVETVVRWVRQVGSRMPVLIAIDAPLGWPDAMRDRPFTSHAAGHPLDGVRADRLFSRETDRQIDARLKKRPLEVGANLIARTALGALDFLRELNVEMNGPESPPLPLAWSPGNLALPCSVVEVYPAATMKAHDIPAGRYKKSGKAGHADRKAVVEALLKQGLKLEGSAGHVADNDDMVDAAVCVLAGWDFLAGRAVAPDSDTRRLAGREGWIWAADRA